MKKQILTTILVIFCSILSAQNGIEFWINQDFVFDQKDNRKKWVKALDEVINSNAPPVYHALKIKKENGTMIVRFYDKLVVESQSGYSFVDSKSYSTQTYYYNKDKKAYFLKCNLSDAFQTVLTGGRFEQRQLHKHSNQGNSKISRDPFDDIMILEICGGATYKFSKAAAPETYLH